MEELTADEKRILQLIYEHFDKGLAWPERKAIQRQLFRLGERKLEVEQTLAPLHPHIVRLDGVVGGQVRLTLRGFRETFRMTEVNDFMCFLRAAIEAYGRHDGKDSPTVPAALMAKRCGLDERRMTKLDLVLEDEWLVSSGARRGADREILDWNINEHVWKFDSAHTVERYLELRSVELAPRPSRTGESIGLAHATVPFANLEPSASPGAVVARVLDEELSSRCRDLLRADAHFDRVIREACVVLENRVRAKIGGSEVGGTSLMEHAFSVNSPRLRLIPGRDQRGAMELYRGVMAFFRNPVGHGLVPEYTREDAERFVVTVDLLLALLARAKIVEQEANRERD
jgi:uncharacterized protein (TIGR02391 family)